MATDDSSFPVEFMYLLVILLRIPTDWTLQWLVKPLCPRDACLGHSRRDIISCHVQKIRFPAKVCAEHISKAETPEEGVALARSYLTHKLKAKQRTLAPLGYVRDKSEKLNNILSRRGVSEENRAAVIDACTDLMAIYVPSGLRLS